MVLSDPNTTNDPYNQAALLLQNSALRSPTELLFIEAAKNVNIKRAHREVLPDIFLRLNSARTPDDVLRVLSEEQAGSVLWKEDQNKPIIHKLSSLSSAILKHKDVIAGGVSTTKIGGPIWGAISFVMGVFQDIMKAEDLLQELQKSIITSVALFEEFVIDRKQLTGVLRSALLEYYELVIDLCIDLTKQFRYRQGRNIYEVVQRTLKEKLETFGAKAKQLRQDVIDSATAKSIAESTSAINDLVAVHAYPQSSVLPSHVDQSSPGPGRRHRLPRSTSTRFVGRQDVLGHIWQTLRTAEYVEMALWGIGGIGKTQILLRYAQDENNKPIGEGYDAIFFIRSSTKELVESEMLKVAHTLDLCNPALVRDPKFATDKVKHWLETHANWLLVFDNVVNYGDVMDVLPNSSKGHVLFSTRDKALALILVPNNQLTCVVHVRPLPPDDGRLLVERLTSSSQLSSSHTDKDAEDISEFAKGLPLAIEQIVNNALFARRPLQETLAKVKQKSQLLQQRNLSSLHEDNASVGGIVAQILEDLHQNNECAEALLKVLCYMEPSSIPKQMIFDGAEQLEAHLNKTVTYDRGQIRRNNQQHELALYDAQVNQRPSPWDFSPLSKKFWQVSLHQGVYKKRYIWPGLPRDMSHEESVLLCAFQPEKALGRLFRTKANLLDAFKTLVSAAFICEQTKFDIEIHDLFAELGRAIVQSESEASNRCFAQASATVVYLAFPTPEHPFTFKNSNICWLYFPHGSSCHSHLRDAGILNDIPIGPELSHLLASTLIGAGRGHLDSKLKQPDANIQTKAISYYRHALIGYATGTKRLQALPGVTNERLALSTFADYTREDHVAYLPGRWTLGYERFGRSAPWRYIQTLTKLGILLSMDKTQWQEAEKLLVSAIKACEGIFGFDHDETIAITGHLLNLYFAQEEWNSAYNLTEKAMKNIFGWDEKKQTYIWKQYGADTSVGAGWAFHRARCCLHLPGREIEAIQWLNHADKFYQWAFGENDYTLAPTRHCLGIAYEKIGKLSESYRQHGSAILQHLNRLKDETRYEPKQLVVLIDNQGVKEAYADFVRLRDLIRPFTKDWMFVLDNDVQLAFTEWEILQNKADASESEQWNRWEFFENETLGEAEEEKSHVEADISTDL